MKGVRIGSIIINHTNLKPAGYRSRTAAYFFLTMITFGIYGLVASICNLTFDPTKEKISVMLRNKKSFGQFI